MRGPLLALFRGEMTEDADRGALFVANVFADIAIIAEILGRKDAEMPPLMPGEEE